MGQVSVINHVTEGDFLIELEVDAKVVKFGLDTGADVTVVGDKCAKGKSLRKPDLALDGVGGNRLNVLGFFYATLHAPNGKTCREKIYVVKDQPKALLGKPAITALGLIKKCFRATPSPEVTVFDDFPALFKGLGTLNTCEYRIELPSKRSSVRDQRTTPHRAAASQASSGRIAPHGARGCRTKAS